MNHNDANSDAIDPDATEVVEMDLEAMLHLELDLQKRAAAQQPRAPRTMPMLKAAQRSSARLPASRSPIPRMPIHTLPPPSSKRDLDDERDEDPTSFYDRRRSSVPSVKSVSFRASDFSIPRMPLPFAVIPSQAKKRDAGESMGITPLQTVLPPTSRRELMPPKSAYDSFPPISHSSNPPPAPKKSMATTVSLVLTLAFALGSVVLMAVAVMKPAIIDQGKTTVSSLFGKSKKAAPAPQAPVAAAAKQPPPAATIAVPPVLFEEVVIEEVGENEAYLVYPESARGHRLFIDGKVVGEGNERGILVECGKHKVQLGSSGTVRTLDLPCGGGWRLSE